MADVATRYSWPMKVFHGLMALILLSLIFVGWYMTTLPDTYNPKWTMYLMHKSFGVCVLALVMLRLITRFFTKLPAFPTTLTRLEITVAHLTHMLLYLLMIMIPLSGYVMSNTGGYPISFFGWFELPPLLGEHKVLKCIFREAHTWVAYTLLGLVVLHILATIKHHWFDHIDGYIRRMW